MASKFLSKYFPPSMVTKLRNDISNFRQLSDESLFEVWERYKLSIDRCLNHNMLPVTQIDTFYNGLTLRHRDTINAAAEGTFMKRQPEECYDLIENMIAHLNDWDTSTQRGESSSSITSSPEIVALTQQMDEMRKDFQQMYQMHMLPQGTTMRVNQGKNYNQNIPQLTYPSTDEMLRNFMISTEAKFNSLATSVIEIKKSLQERPQGGLPSNTIPNPQEDIKVITTQSGMTLAGPSIPSPPSSSSKEVEQNPKTITDQLPPSPSTSSEIPERNPHQPPIPYPSSFPKALAYMPKYAKMVKDLLTNKEKLIELVNTPLNENCAAVLLKKLPEKLGDTRRFLIPCEFQELEFCMALADLGASINLNASVCRGEINTSRTYMELFLTPTSRLYALATTMVSLIQPFIIFPLLLGGRPYFRTTKVLLKSTKHGEELTLRVDDEKLVFNVESTSKYPRKQGDILFLEELLNDDPTPNLLPPLHVFEIKETKKIKTSIEDPPGLDALRNLTFFSHIELVTGWRVCIDYQKLNDATHKDHFPLPFMDQMLERLAGNEFYCFLDGFSGYFQIPIDPQDQEKTTFTCPYGKFAYQRMHFGLCNAQGVW
ncbi:reverse transcriptase domain-containing protein [Tanacetum coccineum]